VYARGTELIGGKNAYLKGTIVKLDSTSLRNLLTDGPAKAPLTVVLAHGAGAPMDSPFMETVAKGIAAGGVRVTRFEFPYMEARRSGGGRAPDREPMLMQSWRSVIDRIGDPPRIVIGGKSMGGRIASMVADDAGVAGLICLGYPFHPPGNPGRTRTRHLEKLRTPTLILQGTRDSFGKPEEVAGYPLSHAIRVVWIEAGDHSFKPTKSSGRTEEQSLAEAIAHALAFLKSLKVPK
jgi:predicted alpha/beta-hydrolase family hydrolase